MEVQNQPSRHGPPGPQPPPRRHFTDDVLLERTVGSAVDGAALAIDCHLALCASCRAIGADLEQIGEALLADAASPDPALRARILDHSAQLPAPLPARAPPPLPAALLDGLPPLPAPLVAAIAALPRPRWRWLIPGMRGIPVIERGRYVARLLRMRPGLVIPSHDHRGPEYTVVFAGGLIDEAGHLGSGDAMLMLPGERHRQHAAAGEGCLALVVNEAPLRPLNPMGRFLKWLARA